MRTDDIIKKSIAENYDKFFAVPLAVSVEGAVIEVKAYNEQRETRETLRFYLDKRNAESITVSHFAYSEDFLKMLKYAKANYIAVLNAKLGICYFLDPKKSDFSAKDEWGEWLSIYKNPKNERVLQPDK
jgi:hypothetical protein